MAEPDHITGEILREIRNMVREINGKVDALTDRVDTVETKLDGLTHAVIAGFGSLVHELDDIKERVGRMERERA